MLIVGSVLVLRVYAAKVDGFDTTSLVFSLMCLVRQIIVFQHCGTVLCEVGGREGGVKGGAGSSVERRAALPGAPVQLEARRAASAGLTLVLCACVS